MPRNKFAVGHKINLGRKGNIPWNKTATPDLRTEKRCTKCEMVKGINCFALRKGRTQRKSWCNPCMAMSAREWRTANPKSARTSTMRWRQNNPTRVLQIERRLYKRHGLSLEQVDLKLAAQAFKCANPGCGVALQRGKGKHAAHLDHDHSSGVVRDFLCHGCNIALGSVGDSCLRLAGLIQYLENHRASVPRKNLA